MKKLKDEMISAGENEGNGVKKEVACSLGCDCGKPSGNRKIKAVICIIVLLAVCIIFVYKAKTSKPTSPINTSAAFPTPVGSEANQPESTAALNIDKQKVPAKTIEEKKRVGEYLDSLSSLKKVAVNQDAVFVFIPAKGSDSVNKEKAEAIASAEQRIESTGVKIGLYTLQTGSQEYANIAAQLTLPGMLVMSKGRGMGAVSGEITETKILQAYVASSRAGGCCPSGGGSSGCAPSSPALGPRR
ncbi:MAG: hypothetical protein ACYSSI_03095 [Planctomycetota bacterium]|jgi:hypothetical protein